jgi:hypothetical protein
MSLFINMATPLPTTISFRFPLSRVVLDALPLIDMKTSVVIASISNSTLCLIMVLSKSAKICAT